MLVYTYLGEGHFRVRHNGQLKDADLEFSPGGGSGGTRCEVEARCWGTLERPHQSTWWIKVQSESGMEGWTAEGARFLHPIDLPARRVMPPVRSEAAIRAARQVVVHDIDAALPRTPFDEWLRQIVGPDVPVTWEVNDCGEQTGNPALDRGRDFPMCAEARADLTGGRTLRVSFMVGTFYGSVAGVPAFHSASFQGPGSPVTDIRTLPQLRAVVRTASRSGAETGVTERPRAH